MKEPLKIINECVLFKIGKVERLDKLNNLRKILYSEFDIHGDIGINLFELIDDDSLKFIDKTYYEVDDSLSICQTSKKQESETINKFDELRNSIHSILVKRNNVVFYAQ